MSRLQSVIVGLSLSESDRHLLRYTAVLASQGIGKKFRFLHVAVPTRHSAESIDVEALRQQMNLYVRDAFGEAASKLDAEFDVRVGVRVDEMLAYIEQQPADFVLLGHRRNRSGKRSLARRLAMISPSSVWMVPEEVDCSITRVLAPIDYSRHAAHSLETAADISQRAGLSECLALHVYFDESTIRYDERDDQIRGNEQATFEQFTRGIENHGVTLSPCFEEDSNVTRAILRVAEERRCDLIVMSTRGRSPAASILLGSETAQTLMESPVPVLAIKHDGALMNLFQVITNSELWSRPGGKTN